MPNMSKHSLSQHRKQEIIDAISCYLKQYDEIYAAYLFGSFVAREPFADIDLGLYLKQTPEDPLTYEVDLECSLEKQVRFTMDVRVLNRAPISFVQNVVRYGRIIVDREPTVRADFENYILKKYFDFTRFRQTYLAEVINAPL